MYFYYNVYVFLLYVYVSSSCQLAPFGYPDRVFRVFPQLYGKARAKPANMGHGPHSSKILCCSMYCLFCVVLCTVCL
jgi:hypothetical protein